MGLNLCTWTITRGFEAGPGHESQLVRTVTVASSFGIDHSGAFGLVV
jgi:hypothetical protein